MSISKHLRDLLGSIYLPSFLTSTAQNATLVLLPLYVLHLGYGPETAALVFACRGFGTLAGDIPGGKVIARFGDRNGMIIGASLNTGAYLLLGLTSHLWLLGLYSFLIGFGTSVTLLGRQSYLTERYPPDERGRIISLLGGVMRGGNFFGPLAGGFLAAFLGYSLVFSLLATLTICSIVLVFLFADHNETAHQEAHASTQGTWALFSEYKKIFLTAGLCMIALQLMRASRVLLLPLIGADMGLDVEVIGSIVAAGAAVDVLMFYPTGIIMDRYGRKYAAVPCFLVFGIGLGLLALAQSELTLLGIALLLGLGNGLSSGMLLILGSDYAPPDNRGRFLGLWRLVGDMGAAGAPAAISLIIKIASLAASGVISGLIGIAAAALMLFAVKEPLASASKPNASSSTLNESASKPNTKESD